VAHFNFALLLAYLHFPLSNGYLIVEVLDYSVLPCFIYKILKSLKEKFCYKFLYDFVKRLYKIFKIFCFSPKKSVFRLNFVRIILTVSCTYVVKLV